MQKAVPEFDRLGAQVVAITFAKPARLRKYLDRHAWTMRFLADPALDAYEAFGLERAGWFQMLGPRSMFVYLKLILQGKMPQFPQEDVHRMGGDFILDSSGRSLYAYRSADPADRPTPAELLKVVAGLSVGGP